VEKYRVLVVCGTGMGSSMILKVMVDRVVSDNQLPIIVDSDVVAGAKSSQADFFVSGLDLVPTLEKIGRPVVGIKNVIDRKEILEKLQEQLAKFKRDATN
jgi:PTS system ascorbate-specific IIB component